VKHFLILLVVFLSAYGLWALSSAELRRTGRRQWRTHGLRLAAVALGLLGLLLLAYSIPALKLL
jgi:hypothetical protein